MVWSKVNFGGTAIFTGTILVLAGVLFLSLSCSSRDGESTTPSYTEGPRISFDQESVYLGEATPEQQIHYEFHFQNVGNASLNMYIASVRTLRGC